MAKKREEITDEPKVVEPVAAERLIVFNEADACELAMQSRCQCANHEIPVGTIIGRLVPAHDVPRDFLIDALRNGVVAVAVP